MSIKNKVSKLVPIALLALLFFQAALGMWTVTLKLLPVVVMGHLLGGLCILSSLWFFYLKLSKSPEPNVELASLKKFAIAGVVILVMQIALGGWVSSNYAALICPDFPFCQGQLLPAMNLHDGFNVLAPIGKNYQGGVLDNTARVTIHMVHRFGALLTFVYLTLLSFLVIRQSNSRTITNLAYATLAVLATQVSLGIMNVKLLLPLHVAVAHNGVAAILLLTVITLCFYIVSEGTTTQQEAIC